jgi:signal transduction histidine kinase
MTTETLVERLRTHATLRDLPDQQIRWLAAHGQLHEYEAGATVFQPSDPIDGMSVILEGHIVIYLDRGAGPRRTLEWRAGDLSGLLPYSRLRESPGRIVAMERTEMLTVSSAHFPEMIRECHELTAACVHTMLDRARHFTSSDLQEEKMLSLGKLAAGLAHELNNPASAATRSADELTRSVLDLETVAVAVGAAGLTPAGYDAVARLRRGHLAGRSRRRRTPVQQSDWEDEVSGWLEAHEIDLSVAETLADSSITLEILDGLAAHVTKDQLRTAVGWFVAGHTARRLAHEIEVATARIYALVAAVKGFTYMDQATVPKPVNVGQGLADTLTVLRAKARARSVDLTLEIEPGLPKVDGFGGELNQVWSNLIDNALDAVDKGGQVRVSAGLRGKSIAVSVADNGSGIPEAARARIFDPFFTTKPPGSGTGLGLDIVRRLVLRHGGEIDVESSPGSTVFRVCLPVART